MNREKKHRIRYAAAGIIIAVLLGGLGYGFGTGFSASTGGTDPGDGPPQTPAQAITAAPEPTQDLRYNVTISERDIEYQGQNITLEDLRERLLEEYSGAEIYELHDDHALKSVYDSVKSLFEDIGVPYMEK